MPLKMSMCFTSRKQIITTTTTTSNTNNLRQFNNSSYMNLHLLVKSKTCSACSGK